jgi:Protein of unknown function (DUF3738).
MKHETYSGSLFAKIGTLAELFLLIASAPFVVGSAGAQTTAAPEFEVASLKVLGGPGALSMRPRRTGGLVRWVAPVPLMLSYAYHLPGWQISWTKVDMTFYELAAKMDPSATEDDVRLMLRALLSDRLRLASHRVTKEVQGYTLVIAKGGPKLKLANSRGEAPPMPEFFRGSPEQIEGKLYTSDGMAWSLVVGRGVPISQLAEELSERLGTFVVDRTGLRGKYYFGFKSHWPNSPSESSEVASVFSVLPDELGLRLVKEKGPVELLVVDHFEKPAAN